MLCVCPRTTFQRGEQKGQSAAPGRCSRCTGDVCGQPGAEHTSEWSSGLGLCSCKWEQSDSTCPRQLPPGIYHWRLKWGSGLPCPAQWRQYLCAELCSAHQQPNREPVCNLSATSVILGAAAAHLWRAEPPRPRGRIPMGLSWQDRLTRGNGN